jgi:hypothetical protein
MSNDGGFRDGLQPPRFCILQGPGFGFTGQRL